MIANTNDAQAKLSYQSLSPEQALSASAKAELNELLFPCIPLDPSLVGGEFVQLLIITVPLDVESMKTLPDSFPTIRFSAMKVFLAPTRCRPYPSLSAR